MGWVPAGSCQWTEGKALGVPVVCEVEGAEACVQTRGKKEVYMYICTCLKHSAKMVGRFTLCTFFVPF